MLKFAANISVLFREFSLLDRFAAAAAAGFAAVEIQLPYDTPASSLADAARSAGVDVVLINGPIDALPGGVGLTCRPEQRQAFRESVDRARDYALALNVRQVNFLAGTCAPGERETCLATLAENLSWAADRLNPDGIRPLLEPLNGHDFPGYIVQTPQQALPILGSVHGAAAGLQYDVYHAAAMDLDPRTTFEDVVQWVAHIQFADWPGRHEPGTGTLAFTEIFGAIAASDYDGWVSAEYRPHRDTGSSLGWYKECATRSL